MNTQHPTQHPPTRNETPRHSTKERPLASEDELPHFHAEPRKLRPPPKQARRLGKPWRILILLVLLLLSAGTWVYTHPQYLARLFPNTRLNRLLDRGTRALTAGHLGGNGHKGALDDYRAVLAMDPDNEVAQAGLTKVGQAELQRANLDLTAGHLDQASVVLDSARNLLGTTPELNRIQSAIRVQGAKQLKLTELVERASQALADSHLNGPNGAAALYDKILAVDPDNAVARHGLRQVGSAIATLAAAALGQNNASQATTRIDQLAALLPNNAQLPNLRAQLVSLQQQNQIQRTQNLQQAHQLLTHGHITRPPGNNALAIYRTVLQQDPGNNAAIAGLARVATALIVQAQANLETGHLRTAKELLAEVQALTPHSAMLAATQAQLEQRLAQRNQTRLTPIQKAKIRHLLKLAQRATSREHYLLPPGASAYDLYRQVLVMDGHNATALAKLAALPERVAQQVSTALGVGKLEYAGNLLSTLAQLAPTDSQLAPQRNRLTQAWLQRATHAFNQGQVRLARLALDQAHKLRPDDPHVRALRLRLQNSTTTQ